MFQQLLARLAGEFDVRQLPYMVIGGQAVLVHGEPRLTRDIDVTIGATPDALEDVLGAVRHVGLKPLVENLHEFVRDTWVLPCGDIQSGIRVDLMFSFTAFEREAMNRAVPVHMDNRTVRVATAEDLVILKILAARPRDLEDARTVLLKNPALDHSYVTRCLTELEADTGQPLLERLQQLSLKV